MNRNMMAKDLRNRVDLYYQNDKEQLTKLIACPNVPGPAGAYLVGQEIHIVETAKKTIGAMSLKNFFTVTEYALSPKLPTLPEDSKIVARIPLNLIIAIDSWNDDAKIEAKWLRVNGELTRVRVIRT